ncbi:nuclear transport factor 2 family protein [Actinoallomurus sp. CA-150999]|uniref:nuclear transport factor 2 family protein n=1 Tax=Actinoallomurus sp. CA-150999 TaxID=3239887 RepID=UPI003D911C1A
MNDFSQFVDRYAAVWNEPEASVRRGMIADLWAEDGVEFTESGEYRGHEEIERRVTGAYEEFVREGGFVFRPAGEPVGHHDAVRFTVEMAPATGGDAVWNGSIFVVLGEDGLIRYDYQFAGDPDPGTRAVAREYLRRLVAGDPEHVAEIFAEKVDWRLDWPAEGHPAVPWIRPRSSRADVADHFRTIQDFHVPQEQGSAAEEIVVDGPDAVILGEIRQTVKATGEPYTALCAVRLTVEDGLITRYHVYEDSLTVAEALARADAGR